MKRFDYAAEVAKQLITICSAIIAVVLTFNEKFLSPNNFERLLMLMVLVLFLLSICFGVLSLGGITGLIERQERIDDKLDKTKKPDKTKMPVQYRFIKLNGSQAQRFAKRQQICFGLGFLLFIGIAFLDLIFRIYGPENSLGIG